MRLTNSTQLRQELERQLRLITAIEDPTRGISKNQSVYRYVDVNGVIYVVSKGSVDHADFDSMLTLRSFATELINRTRKVAEQSETTTKPMWKT